MRTLTISINSAETAMQQMQARFIQAWKSGAYAGEFLGFESPAALFRAITSKRWELIGVLQRLGTTSIRELARQLKRDVHRVHSDVAALKSLGIIEQTDAGICIPFHKIHTDFTLLQEAA